MIFIVGLYAGVVFLLSRIFISPDKPSVLYDMSRNPVSKTSTTRSSSSLTKTTTTKSINTKSSTKLTSSLSQTRISNPFSSELTPITSDTNEITNKPTTNINSLETVSSFVSATGDDIIETKTSTDEQAYTSQSSTTVMSDNFIQSFSTPVDQRKIAKISLDALITIILINDDKSLLLVKSLFNSTSRQVLLETTASFSDLFQAKLLSIVNFFS